MIVNMSNASDGCHSVAPITTTSSSSAMPANGSTEIPMPPTTNQQQGHSNDAMSSGQFNFLKRKLDTPTQQQPQQQTNEANLLDDYQTDTNNWKKRHVDIELTHNYGVSNFVVEDFNVTTTTTTTTSPTTTSHCSTDIAFTNSSAFINDLFTYDANLMPVSANLVSHTAADPPSLSTTTGICLNSVTFGESSVADGGNWQATDLLELDHRYNAGLQTEISQLNPTIALKPAQEDNLRAAELQHRQQEQEQQQQHGIVYDQTQQQQQHHGDFIVPHKQQMTRHQNPTYSTGKYRQPQNDNDTDTDQFEDKNLSWLLNFKFDEFPHLSPDVGSTATNARNCAKNSASTSLTTTTTTPNTMQKSQSPPSTASSTTASLTNLSPSHIQNESSKSPKTAGSTTNATSSKVGKKFEELVMEVTAELDGTETAPIESFAADESPVKAPKKPPFTYTELIEYALEDKGELTVSGIYQWISDRFPYYKSNDDRWKNSVRHNLSINPHFRKGLKAPQGAGHLWTISSGDSAENVLAWEHKKQRLDLFFKMESMNRERLQQHKLQQQQQQQQQQQHQQQPLQTTNGQHEQLFDEAATAAATIAQEMSQQPSIATQQQQQRQQTLTQISDSHQHHHHHHEDPHMGGHFHDLLNDDELRKTAGQILNGIHRDVEVQSVNSIISTYQDVLLDNDFLNPINKDISLMHSQSLHGPSSHYYVTEIDPLELGIQMSHQVHGVEEEVLFNDEFNLNYFYNPGNDIVA